jgi:hypothetical protein
MQIVEALFKFPPFFNMAAKSARRKIVQRGESVGVDWSGTMAQLQAQDWAAAIQRVQDPQVQLPGYYQQPFHAYPEVCAAGGLAAAAARLQCLQLRRRLQGRPAAGARAPNHLPRNKYGGSACSGRCKVLSPARRRSVPRPAGAAATLAAPAPAVVLTPPGRPPHYVCLRAAGQAAPGLGLLGPRPPPWPRPALQGNLCWDAALEVTLAARSVHSAVMDPAGALLDPE